MTVKNYRDLIVWKKAFDLVLVIYDETSRFPIDEKYGLTMQLRKAGVSISSNIAEGEGRNSKAEFRHHLFFALGSLKEVETQIQIAEALGYINPSQAAMILVKTSEVGRLINGLSRSLLAS
jgi:four helix bundle protein